MPQQPHAVSPSTTKLSPQDFITDIPRLTRQQRLKCAYGQQKFIWNLYVVEGHFGEMQYVLIEDQVTVYRVGILESAEHFATGLVIKIAYLHQGSLHSFSRTLPDTKFVELLGG